MWAMDGSGPSVEMGIRRLPRPRAFPADFFGRRYQWNVTLNPKLFELTQKLTADQIGSTTSTATRTCPTTRWPTPSWEYFNVDLGGYGVPNIRVTSSPRTWTSTRARATAWGVPTASTARARTGPLVYLVEFF